MTVEDWNAVIASNLNALFNLTKQVVDGMATRGWGRIINIGSVSAHKGQIGQVYATAKAAMHGFSRALAAELRRAGSPSTRCRRATSPARRSAASAGCAGPAGASVPVRRLGRPEEVAGLVGWLASDEASYVTGADYAVNGGLYMG